MPDSKIIHKDCTVSVSMAADGKLTKKELNKSLLLWEHVKVQNAEVHILSGSRLRTQSIEKMKDAVKSTLASPTPMYVFNTHTSIFANLRFYTQPGDMLEWVEDFYAHVKGPAFKLSEDIMVGSKGSYTDIHVDHAPCVPARVTVLQGLSGLEGDSGVALRPRTHRRTRDFGVRKE
jgi:hypothetical protein